MKACIIYDSQHGTTQAYAGAIAAQLKEKGIDSDVASIEAYNQESLKSADIVLLGAWTSGLFFFGQHPEKVWQIFAEKLPDIKGKKIGLFTTYKLATGSMFRKMKACLDGKTDEIQLFLKARSSKLSSKNIVQLDNFLS